jgi:predicted PhzF superfamily epimerase YddE/YHI9
MSGGKTAGNGGCRWQALRGWALGFAWVLLLILLVLLVFRDRAFTSRLDDLEARAGALEAFAKRQRGQIADLQAGRGRAASPARPDTVALVIELAGDDFPQVIVRAGLDAEHEHRIVLLLPSQDRQRLEEMRKEWPTLAEPEKQRFVGVMTAAIEDGIRREAPALFVPRRDIEEELRTALDSASGALDNSRPNAGVPAE